MARRPARHISSLSGGERLFWGLVCIAIGLYPVAVGLGLFPVQMLAPPWVAVAIGVCFLIAGLMILLAKHERANDLLAGVILLVFGILGIWVAIFSSDDGFSGGIPFLSRETNILIARWAFGLGTLISFSMCAWAFRRAFTRSDNSA